MPIAFHSIGDGVTTGIAGVGGKASNLFKMQRHGFPVPAFFALPASAINEIIAPVRQGIEVLCATLGGKDDVALSGAATEIYNAIISIQIPPNSLAEIAAACTQIAGANYLVAVRSSAIAEDGSVASFAGQHDSLLYVDSESLGISLLKVIASGWSFAALKYRSLQGLPLKGVQFAVVVQQMVAAEKSGVGFSMNIAGNMADMLLVAGYGLGEGIVADKVETDTYTVNRQMRLIDTEVAHKTSAVVYSPGKGLAVVPVDETKGHQPTLSEAQVFEVCDYMASAEKLLGTPADIEFSFDADGKLYLLQMRPITTLNRDKIKILDNTNIVESYPGITLPLTYSFVADAYQKVFSGSAGAFMVAPQTIKKYALVFENLLEHFDGRIYYRLDNWYRMLSLVHNSRKSMEAWEQAVGLADGAADKVNFSFRNKFRAGAASAKLIVNYKRGNKRFFKEFTHNYTLLRGYQENLASPAALWAHYEKSTALLFKPWHLTIVNDFIAFKAFGWLQGLIKKYMPEASAGLANDLLCGIGGIDSEETILSVLELKEEVKQNPELVQLFTLPAAETWKVLQQEKHKAFYAKACNYLEKFGDRTLAELKLETKSLRRNPEIFISMLRNQLPSGTTAADFRGKQQQIREGAETAVNQKLKWWQPSAIALNTMLRLARYGLKQRENMRFCRTRGYSAVKDIFLEVGIMMVGEKVIDAQEDVFYLTMQDLKSFCTEGNRDSKAALITGLKALYEKYGTLTLPDRVMYMDGSVPVFDKNKKKASPEAGTFQGLAVSKGAIDAEAIVITEPRLDADVRGKILVSKMTDPGWVFLMAQAAGMVCEKGSLLSHTAIVGRELGIPVVVGVTGATSIFKNGDYLHLDGDAGTVAFKPKAV